MNRIISIILFLTFIESIQGQNIFKQKVSDCNASSFCLDCGVGKAIYDLDDFNNLLNKLNKNHDFSGVNGKIGFQVLVDSIGKGCVISHTDESNNKITQEIIKQLTQSRWISATEKGKPINASISIYFEIGNGKITGSVERIDLSRFDDNMFSTGVVEIENKHYLYDNRHLADYEIITWNKSNSNVPYDMSTDIAADKNDVIWLGTHNGLVSFDSIQMITYDESNSKFKWKYRTLGIKSIAVDKYNRKWMYVDSHIYKYEEAKWTVYDSLQTGIDYPYDIIPTADGKVLFPSDRGLLVFEGGKFKLLTTKEIAIPSNQVRYAYQDKMQRLWVGTKDGTVMIDKNQKVIDFNKTENPLKNGYIDNAAEDNEGNLWFSIYSKIDGGGLVKYAADSTYTLYNIDNSGIPTNIIYSIVYDPFEDVLWIASHNVGVTRFDKKDSWETYNINNSKVPSYLVMDLCQDSKGNIWGATYYGLMRIKRIKH